MFRLFADLTKLGIVIFVVLSGLAGYALSYFSESVFSSIHLLKVLSGLFFLSAGSLALNQVQEYKTDQLMARTAKRPVASGVIKPAAAVILAFSFIFSGSYLLFLAEPWSCFFGFLTIILYNGLYTYWWKPRWAFAAVPGAIPGALPVIIGFVANSTEWWRVDSLYLFVILFLWQMPHFWVLAVRYKEDYGKGKVPTLPNVIGMQRTFFHLGLYTFLYAFMALVSPFFVPSSWFYILLVLPVTVKVFLEFKKYLNSQAEKWIGFFIWLNLSVLVYLFAPVLDKWSFLIFPSM